MNKGFFRSICLALALPASIAADESKFKLTGYGELIYSHFDYGPDQKSGPAGSPSDSRATIDIARLSLELETHLLRGVELEAEVEIEHGGTGGALEIEYEEFGEYETEVEKGGEIVLEELYVEREFGDAFNIRLGHFYVGVGLITERYHPMDFFGTRRPESEAAVIPAIWHETGIEINGEVHRLRYRVQLVNGLDATGFSSQQWIVGGHQTRFEDVRASNMALAARLDYRLAEGMTLGVSGYRGNSADNRPKPDMKDADAHVSIFDVHAVLRYNRLRAQGMYLYGHLQNAAIVSTRNRTLSNNLDVLRTPVASAAYALYAEVGYDILPFFTSRKEEQCHLFFRFDAYDTMAETPPEFFDNPRFSRRVYTVGVNYAMGHAVVLKGDYAMRRLGAANFNGENTASFALGFQF